MCLRNQSSFKITQAVKTNKLICIEEFEKICNNPLQATSQMLKARCTTAVAVTTTSTFYQTPYYPHKLTLF